MANVANPRTRLTKRSVPAFAKIQAALVYLVMVGCKECVGGQLDFRVCLVKVAKRLLVR